MPDTKAKIVEVGQEFCDKIRNFTIVDSIGSGLQYNLNQLISKAWTYGITGIISFKLKIFSGGVIADNCLYYNGEPHFGNGIGYNTVVNYGIRPLNGDTEMWGFGLALCENLINYAKNHEKIKLEPLYWAPCSPFNNEFTINFALDFSSLAEWY